MAILVRNGWPFSIGMSGHFGPEYTVGQRRRISSSSSSSSSGGVHCWRNTLWKHRMSTTCCRRDERYESADGRHWSSFAPFVESHYV